MSQCATCGAFSISNSDESDFAIPASALTRISELLATNEPPHEPELPLIRSVAQKTAGELASVGAQISRLRDQLSQLEEKQTALAEYHAQTARILSPMRRIPMEILGEIFSWSLPAHGQLDMVHSPWVLTHVSRLWRAVAVFKSSLWSRLYLDFSHEQKYSLTMARTQIERAHTLKIAFWGCHRPDSRSQVDFLELLLDHSTVWEEFRLQLTRALIPPMAACRGHFPLLRRVWVQWDGPESQAAMASVDFLRMAASLVEICVYSRHRFVPTLLPSTHQLTRYTIDAPWTMHYELLKSLPNLHEVRIIRSFERGVPWPPAGQLIHLLYLRCMYVSHVECLDYLRAPSLQTIGFKSRRNVTTRRHLEPFVTRSSCVFRRLCIVGLPDVQTTERILQQYPSITGLAVWIMDLKTQNQDTERDVLATFLTHFTISDSARILPRISNLALACRNADAISYPLYLDMIDSRWSARDCALKDAELLLPNALADPDTEFLARMAILRNHGMHISHLLGDIALERIDQWLEVP
ncbi:F-box domain-containing protein [Mycena sanguinolenta]|uniref:F-box domain-containing protein n=1 Tax=Mycena sanguinolenta TaxID=230812 RepID=A0A8H6XNN0_9AGAR|nr:F-box domain-containing protein [Mycena sanguinolenta]